MRTDDIVECLLSVFRFKCFSTENPSYFSPRSEHRAISTMREQLTRNFNIFQYSKGSVYDKRISIHIYMTTTRKIKENLRRREGGGKGRNDSFEGTWCKTYISGRNLANRSSVCASVPLCRIWHESRLKMTNNAASRDANMRCRLPSSRSLLLLIQQCANL